MRIKELITFGVMLLVCTLIMVPVLASDMNTLAQTQQNMIQTIDSAMEIFKIMMIAMIVGIAAYIALGLTRVLGGRPRSGSGRTSYPSRPVTQTRSLDAELAQARRQRIQEVRPTPRATQRQELMELDTAAAAVVIKQATAPVKQEPKPVEEAPQKSRWEQLE